MLVFWGTLAGSTFWGALGALTFGVALARPLSAQHPPLNGFYEEADWITLADFRQVTAIAAGDGDVFVGTPGGLAVLSPFGGGWKATVTAGDGLPSSVVSALAFESLTGRLWIGTPLGLAIYDPFRGEVTQDPLALGRVPVRDIRAGSGGSHSPGLTGSADGLGSRDTLGSLGTPASAAGPPMYVHAGGVWYRSDPFTRSTAMVPEREVPRSPAPVELREIPFLGGDVVRGERSGVPESFRITAAAPLADQRLALGTWGAGVYLYDPVRQAAEPSPYGLAGPGGGALGWDGRRLWFSNAPRSAFAGDLDRARFAAPVKDRGAISSAAADLTGWGYAYPGLEPALVSDRVYDIAAGDGRTFFATEAGLAAYDPDSGGWVRFPPGAGAGEEILAVESAADGVWLGTRNGLVGLRWHSSGKGPSGAPGRPAADSLRAAGRWLEGRAVRSLAADARDLYAGTDRGLFRLNPDEGGSREWTLAEVKTVGREVRDLALLEEEIVVATDRGVELLPRKGGEPLLFLVGEGHLDHPPLSVAADASNIWVGTGAGVARWDRARRLWTEYGLADGLPELPVLDILVQDRRTVWFSTRGGVTRFDLGDPPRPR